MPNGGVKVYQLGYEKRAVKPRFIFVLPCRFIFWWRGNRAGAHAHAPDRKGTPRAGASGSCARLEVRLAGAIRYATSRWAALTRYVDDGHLEMSNNAAERAIRPIALGRKNFLFAGSDAGGRRAAIMYTLIEFLQPQRNRSRGLAHFRHRTHRRSSNQSHRRTLAMELATARNASARRLIGRAQSCDALRVQLVSTSYWVDTKSDSPKSR